MAGTINLAFTQQFDMDGVPLSGGLLYFFTAGTTTPQSAFQDTGLTITHPNPIILDASGRVPMFYLADGFIKIRLTDKNGVTVIAADQLLVIGPSSGGGGGGGGTAGDVTQLMSTGDIKARYSTIAIDGFVRCNGLTIGNTGSSATERADPACQPLFVYLWAFSNITLDGFAKGANALADFGAGRRLFLPDMRGRTIAGLDDMGNPTPANRLTSTYFGASGIVLGNAGGDEKHTLLLAELAQHSHGTFESAHAHAVSQTAHTHNVTDPTHLHALQADHALLAGDIQNQIGSSGPGQRNSATTYASNFGNLNVTAAATGISIQGNLASVTINGNTTGLTINNSPTSPAIPHAGVSPAMVLTFYMKM